jgi:hypothetical protein
LANLERLGRRLCRECYGHRASARQISSDFAGFLIGVQTQYELERAEDELGAELSGIAPAP